jgi:hypothetical protein
MNSELKYIANKQIDTKKWDECIGNSANSRVYAFSWFLDRVAKNWDALVWGDYKYVMPLTFNRKWGLTYLYQPTFCQQLGVFPEPPDDIQQQFAQFVFSKYRYVQIQVTPQMQTTNFKQFAVTPKTNQVLPLIAAYPEISMRFSQNTKRNIAKAKNESVTVMKGLNPADFISAKKMADTVKSSFHSFKNLEKIIAFSLSESTGTIYAAYTSANELCAAAFFLHSGNRVVYLSAFSSSEGKKNRAMHLIVDEFISEFAGSGILLDFEGSSIEGVARFYNGFGALTETYCQLTLNRLPFPLTLFKK